MSEQVKTDIARNMESYEWGPTSDLSFLIGNCHLQQAKKKKKKKKKRKEKRKEETKLPLQVK